jgi:hypothetical protein
VLCLAFSSRVLLQDLLNQPYKAAAVIWVKIGMSTLQSCLGSHLCADKTKEVCSVDLQGKLHLQGAQHPNFYYIVSFRLL